MNDIKVLYDAIHKRYKKLLLELANKEDVINKTTSLDDLSTDTQYPSAKSVYSALQNVDDNTIILDGNKWSLASIDGLDTTGLTKAEAIEFLGWTEDEFDTLLPESVDELPKPCIVYFNGYYFPQYKNVESDTLQVSVLMPRYVAADARSSSIVFEELKILAYTSSDPNANGEILYDIYGLLEGQQVL